MARQIILAPISSTDRKSSVSEQPTVRSVDETKELDLEHGPWYEYYLSKRRRQNKSK